MDMPSRAKGFTDQAWARSETILETPDVVDRIDEAGRFLGQAAASFLGFHVTAYGRSRVPFESPLEAIFFAWWWAWEMGRTTLYFENLCGPWLYLRPQHWVEVEEKRYRLDFLVQPAILSADMAKYQDRHFPKVAIELDGHEFHEKTREQVTAGNQRDRALQKAGWTVFHVSGSELFRRPKDVTREIHDHCVDAYHQFQYLVYKETSGADTLT
jgi:very-short-patch-repair endonuclease